MEFLIFSDSHGRSDSLSHAFQRQIKAPDAVCFLGDGLRDLSAGDFYGSMLYAVQGNCDWTPRLADGAFVNDELLLQLEGHRILLCHGHRYQVKSGMGALLMQAVRMDADAVLFGHTHTPLLCRMDVGECVCGTRLAHPITLFNPGSIGHGGSFGTLSLSGNTLLFSHGKI